MVGVGRSCPDPRDEPEYTQKADEQDGNCVRKEKLEIFEDSEIENSACSCIGRILVPFILLK